MIAAPIPVDEVGRLESLQTLDLLDTPHEERFDRITRLLTLVMRVPMAFLSLVDNDRQWFKSTSGICAIQTPRAVSFCAHAILSDEPMIVPNALLDHRFRDNPLVTGKPGIRFYAGHPLHGPGGHKVGTLCIADSNPRILSRTDIEVLSEFARVVERELNLVDLAHLQHDLIASKNHLTNELAQAAKYVYSLLPKPGNGPVQTRWRFEPSSELGGDCFGHDWIDPDHFAVYLLDVSGHGVGAALLSVSVANALRSRSLPGTDFRDPSAVLARLNDDFPMERHDDRYFTIWYGVFNRKDRTLTYSSGGHPPALLWPSSSHNETGPIELGVGNLAVGMLPGISFESEQVTLGPSSILYLFSDGVYEIQKPGGTMMTRHELRDHLASTPDAGDPDDVWRFVQRTSDNAHLADDFSFLEVVFP
ncbi:MAG: GAF domain-containing SpoIIE family protein phosphatase [Isosphaeraceae bacterium]